MDVWQLRTGDALKGLRDDCSWLLLNEWFLSRMKGQLSRVLAVVLGLATISYGFQASLAALRPHRLGLGTSTR